MTEVSRDDRTPLEKITDLLLELHRLTQAEGDARLQNLVERALLHVGRRLAMLKKPVNHRSNLQ